MREEEPVEQILHIEEMKAELRELSGGQMLMGEFGDTPLELEESFSRPRPRLRARGAGGSPDPGGTTRRGSTASRPAR